MKILGVHDGHCAAACLLVDGRLVAAQQEERLNRVKNWSGLPVRAIAECLRLGGVGAGELDAVALAGRHMPYPKSREEILEEYRATSGLRTRLKRLLKGVGLRTLHQERRRRERVAAIAALGIPAARVSFVEHHLAHASAAYYGWGDYRNDVLVLTNDGAGDGLCATVSVGRAGELRRVAEVPESESLGNVYAMTTFLLGMVPLEHEYKLMGMAPYAPEKGAELVYRDLAACFDWKDATTLAWRRRAGTPPTYYTYDFLRRLYELRRFDWVAAGLQRFTERMLVEWVRRAIAATGVRRVALSGGVFMNVKANKLILELPEVESLFVFPSCGDETNALGAAWRVHAEARLAAGRPVDLPPLGACYLGAEYGAERIEAALAAAAGSVTWTRPASIAAEAARLLAAGEVVARFAGRSEFGARALGNRSILADASRPEAVRTINEMIKSRDFWMPFAPSILAERCGDYLINPKGMPAPYMILSFDTTERRGDLAAAIHPYDRTARPQAVHADGNPGYHALLKEYERLTGRGGLLNTSFNIHGFPIVETPEDALQVLRESGLKYLALGPFLVRKTANGDV
ncbi:MAG: carbamoyltransferase [Planctomycetes bacterium]|nr:carbamoyltransferase [Planctomycetota bacterium]